MIVEFGYSANHSEDMTVVAVFGTDKEAYLAHMRLVIAVKRFFDLECDSSRYDEDEEDVFFEGVDWGIEDAHIALDGNEIAVNLYTAGYVSDICKILQEAGGDIQEDPYRTFQSFEDAHQQIKKELGLLKKRTKKCQKRKTTKQP